MFCHVLLIVFGKRILLCWTTFVKHFKTIISNLCFFFIFQQIQQQFAPFLLPVFVIVVHLLLFILYQCDFGLNVFKMKITCYKIVACTHSLLSLGQLWWPRIGCSQNSNKMTNSLCSFLHCTLASATVYCNQSCLCVCVCLWWSGGRAVSVTMLTQNCVHRSSPNWVCRCRQ